MDTNQSAQHTPELWKIEFCMPLTKHAGLYVSRALHHNKAKEWLLRNGKPARFASREAAIAAIAKATGSAA